MSARTLGIISNLRCLVSKLQRSGQRSPEVAKGPAFAPLPAENRRDKILFRQEKHLVDRLIKQFVESGERAFQDGLHPSADQKAEELQTAKADDDFSRFSNLFFPEDMDQLRAFSKKENSRDPSLPPSGIDNSGQSSVNTKSTWSSYESGKLPHPKIPPPRSKTRRRFLSGRLTDAFGTWVNSLWSTPTLIVEQRQLDDYGEFTLPILAKYLDAERYRSFLFEDRAKTRIEAAIERLDEYIESTNKKPFDERLKLVRKVIFDLPPIVETSDQWTSYVEAMKEIRELKEIQLSMPKINEGLLDDLDNYETRVLSIIYGNFQYLCGFTSQPTPNLFDKNTFDERMESIFGSIDHPNPDGDLLSVEEARKIFSMYLARKIWCLNPWRKYRTATDKFYERVCTDIGRDQDRKATKIAKQILRAMLSKLSKEEIAEARAFEHAPESACLERSRQEGGKRFAILTGFRKAGDYVKPVSIYTGGKIRVITKDSAKNVKFNFINKLLGSTFKKLKCSVFGGDVSEWWTKIGGLKPKKGEFYCSGDLESATDLFDGRITDELIEILADFFHMNRDEMASFTSRAVFKGGRKQKRGQLMGSVISFPLLCILSLTAYLYEHKDVERFLNSTSEGAWKFLYKLSDVGINGDDIVFAGNMDRINSWLNGVRAVGGVVSRGKSLVNSEYFTVNSELWHTGGKINVARPSLISALTGDNRYFITPQFEWKEYNHAHFLPKRAREIFDIKRKLKINIPTYLGGTGLEKEFDPESMFLAYKATQIEREFSNVFLASANYLSEKKEREADLEGFGSRHECWLTRNMVKAYSRLFESNKMNFRLKPNEIRFSLAALARPDIFPTQHLEPFRHQFENLQFPTRARYEAQCEASKSTIISLLRKEYDWRMDGLKRKKIPIGLMRSFNALIEDEVADVVRAELEFLAENDQGLPWNLDQRITTEPYSAGLRPPDVGTVTRSPYTQPPENPLDCDLRHDKKGFLGRRKVCLRRDTKVSE